MPETRAVAHRTVACRRCHRYRIRAGSRRVLTNARDAASYRCARPCLAEPFAHGISCRSRCVRDTQAIRTLTPDSTDAGRGRGIRVRETTASHTQSTTSKLPDWFRSIQAMIHLSRMTMPSRLTALAVVSVVGLVLTGCGGPPVSAGQDAESSTRPANSTVAVNDTRDAGDDRNSSESHDETGHEQPNAALADYVDALNEGAFDRAYHTWRAGGDGAPASANALAARFKTASRIKLQITDKTRTEGAAGTLYATVPIRVTIETANGTETSRSGDCVLARTNDIPGASAAQRRWRLYDCSVLSST